MNHPQQQESWEEKLMKSKQEERYNQTLEFLFDSSRGEKQVFIDELAKQWAESLSTERQRVLSEVEDWINQLPDWQWRVTREALVDKLNQMKARE